MNFQGGKGGDGNRTAFPFNIGKNIFLDLNCVKEIYLEIWFCFFFPWLMKPRAIGEKVDSFRMILKN